MMNTGGYLPDIWKRLGRAQGDVVIPEGRQVGLSLDPSTADMKQLLKFGANDIDQLMVTGPGNSALTFEMDVLPYIRHMRGLKGLMLMDVGIGGGGGQVAQRFPVARALWIGSVVQAHPVSLRDADLPALGDLKQLEILSVSSERITDAGLAQLARVKTLRWLEINTTNIKGPGLAELSKLSNLEFFSPCGFGFNNQKLQYLAGNTTIKRLPLGGTAKFMQIDDDSLAILARVKGIEDLNFHWNESITDAGVAHLAAMPHLKTLDINHSRVTAKGIASLKNVKARKWTPKPPSPRL